MHFFESWHDQMTKITLKFIVSFIYDLRYKMFDVDILCSPCDWLNVCSCVLEVYMRSCTIVDSS